LDDDNKILDDTYTMLFTPAHLARQLCDDPRELEITLFYCVHPQYNVTDGAEVATPGANVRIGSTIKAERDFGVRRWLADAGCGRDLVSTSVVLKGWGNAYVRVRPPNYLNVAHEGDDNVHPTVGRDGRRNVSREHTICPQYRQEMCDRGICLLLATILGTSVLCQT
jgi:hypothetical protein